MNRQNMEHMNILKLWNLQAVLIKRKLRKAKMRKVL